MQPLCRPKPQEFADGSQRLRKKDDLFVRFAITKFTPENVPHETTAGTFGITHSLISAAVFFVMEDA